MNTGFLKLLTVALIVVFFAVFLLLPIYTVVEEGLRWNLICEVFRNPLYMEGLLNSFLLAVVTTFLVFLISLPLALIYDKLDFPGKGVCNLAMMLPMILPPFVGALGFMQILGHYGVINTILVDFGLELDLTSFCADGTNALFELFAVIVHNGHQMHKGHFMCYVMCSNGIWYSADDSRVAKVSTNSVLMSRPYILFYKRRQVPLTKPIYVHFEMPNAEETENEGYSAGAQEPEEEEEEDEVTTSSEFEN